MNSQQSNRYSRQIRLDQIGELGQQTIIDSTVLIIGMGGLGSPAALYLAASGVGKLVISDFDIVEESNLHRQIIHTNHAIGNNKVDSAKSSIKALNPHCEVETINYQIDGGIDYLKQVVIEDSIGIAEDLESEMQGLVNKYECEWKQAIENEEVMKRFKHFVNSDDTDDNIKFVKMRAQKKPKAWV
jgi:hypothetical protein